MAGSSSLSTRASKKFLVYIKMKKIVQFLKDSVDELKYKVSWPEYKKLQSDSVLVLVASIIFALVVFAIDFVFKNGMEEIYKSF